jgi:hypothetical protein
MMKTTPHVLFNDIRHLVHSLHTFQIPFSQYGIVEIPDEKYKGWAVSLALFENGSFNGSFAHLQRQYSWNARVVSQCPEGNHVNLMEILESKWRYLDPLTLNPDAGDRVRNHYILGARDQEHAQRLLDDLTNFLTPGIHARPVLLVDKEIKKSRVSFFWKIVGQQPPISVLRDAERVWWGPMFPESFDRRVQYYEEWPYETEDPEILTYKIDWNDKKQIVLLGKHEPERLVVKFESAKIAEFNPLIDVSNIHVKKKQTIELKASPPGETLKFNVELKLVDKDFQQSCIDQINRLKLEIKATEALLARMESQNEEIDDDFLVPEPLFLYYQDRAEEGSVPDEIRRLILEWTDQKKDLESLQYQKVKGRSLPPELFPEKMHNFMLTDRSLANIKESDIPPPILAYLQELKDREYSSQEEFLNAVKTKILDNASFVRYRNHILQHTARKVKDSIDVHIITTPGALPNRIKQNGDFLGLRLRNYPPPVAMGCSFELLPKWASHNLHLFVRQNQNLDLYPRLKEGPEAAHKLSEVLFSKNQANMETSIVLLITTSRGPIHAYQLDTRSFKPLYDSFKLECALDITLGNPGMIKIGNDAGQQLLTTITNNFHSCIKETAEKKLERQKERLKKQLESQGKRIQQRDEILSGFGLELNDIDRSLAGIGGLIPFFLDSLNQLKSVLYTFKGDVNQLKALANKFMKLDETISKLKTEEQLLQAARERIKERVNKINKLW